MLVFQCGPQSSSYTWNSTSSSSNIRLDKGHWNKVSMMLEWQNSHLHRRITFIDAQQQSVVVWQWHCVCTYWSEMHVQSNNLYFEPGNLHSGAQSKCLINQPIDNVSRSLQCKQKPHSQAQSSWWWAKIMLCKVESHWLNCLCSMQTQNLWHENQRKKERTKSKFIVAYKSKWSLGRFYFR